MNLSLLQDVVNDWGNIGTIYVDGQSPTFLSKVEIRFENDEVLLVEVNVDNDTVIISQLKARVALEQFLDVSDIRPWKCLIGRQLLWAWVMTNHLGFVDGVQFGAWSGGNLCILQLLAVASSLKPYEIAFSPMSDDQSA